MPQLIKRLIRALTCILSKSTLKYRIKIIAQFDDIALLVLFVAFA